MDLFKRVIKNFSHIPIFGNLIYLSIKKTYFFSKKIFIFLKKLFMYLVRKSYKFPFVGVYIKVLVAIFRFCEEDKIMLKLIFKKRIKRLLYLPFFGRYFRGFRQSIRSHYSEDRDIYNLVNSLPITLREFKRDNTLLTNKINLCLEEINFIKKEQQKILCELNEYRNFFSNEKSRDLDNLLSSVPIVLRKIQRENISKEAKINEIKNGFLKYLETENKKNS